VAAFVGRGVHQELAEGRGSGKRVIRVAAG
jgi:hypothetical protein